jgi:FkbM family methyltransferase
MEQRTQTFKEKEFKVIKGTTHPEYSYFTFEQEEKSFRDQYWDIKPDDVVFDIGASYGAYTLTACVMGAVVYSFEPEKTVFDDLVQNISINNWNDRCFPENIGIWDHSDSINMESYAPHWPKQTISGAYTMESIDNIVKNKQLSKLDWIKIDIEGAEVNAIQGGLETINKFKPKLLIECHIFLDSSIVDKIKTMLTNYNFEEIPRDPCIMLLATPN